MRLFNAIFGFFGLFAALYCLFWTSTPLFYIGWILAFLLGLRGLCAVIIYGVSKREQRVYPHLLVTGIIGIVIGVAAIVVSCLTIKDQFVFALIVLVMFVAGLVLDGIFSISSANGIRRQYGTRWKLRLILGIITLALGVFSIIASCIGFIAAKNTICWSFLIYGCVLMASVFDRDESVEDSELW